MQPLKRYLVLTLFPEVFPGTCGVGVIGRALQQERFALETLDLREFGEGKHRILDDTPYGGGDGMVMKAPPLARAIQEARKQMPQGSPVVLMSPQGQPFTQKHAQTFSQLPGMILLCGRYEGLDERLRERYVDQEISIGDYVLSGGEVAAMTLLDCTLRLLPDVLGNPSSIEDESFQTHRLEYPQYTRPADFEGQSIPSVLLSGHHQRIREWRTQQSLLRTQQRRPDLLERFPPTPEEQKLLHTLPQPPKKPQV